MNPHMSSGNTALPLMKSLQVAHGGPAPPPVALTIVVVGPLAPAPRELLAVTLLLLLLAPDASPSTTAFPPQAACATTHTVNMAMTVAVMEWVVTRLVFAGWLIRYEE